MDIEKLFCSMYGHRKIILFNVWTSKNYLVQCMDIGKLFCSMYEHLKIMLSIELNRSNKASKSQDKKARIKLILSSRRKFQLEGEPARQRYT